MELGEWPAPCRRTCTGRALLASNYDSRGKQEARVAGRTGRQRAAAEAAAAAAPPHMRPSSSSGGSGRQGACSSSSPHRPQPGAGRHPARVGRAQAWMGGRSAGAAGGQLPRLQPATAGRGRAAMLEAWRACLSQKPEAGRQGSAAEAGRGGGRAAQQGYAGLCEAGGALRCGSTLNFSVEWGVGRGKRVKCTEEK